MVATASETDSRYLPPLHDEYTWSRLHRYTPGPAAGAASRMTARIAGDALAPTGPRAPVVGMAAPTSASPHVRRGARATVWKCSVLVIDPADPRSVLAGTQLSVDAAPRRKAVSVPERQTTRPLHGRIPAGPRRTQ